MSERKVVVEGTPNPNAAKFVVRGGALVEKSCSYFAQEEAAADPLAARLFQIEGVRALLLVDNFVTVTKAEEVSWDDLVQEIQEVIEKAVGE